MKPLCSRCTVLALGVFFLALGVARSAMAWGQSVSVQLWVTTFSDSVLNAAFRNPDSSLVRIAYNNTKQAQAVRSALARAGIFTTSCRDWQCDVSLAAQDRIVAKLGIQ